MNDAAFALYVSFPHEASIVLVRSLELGALASTLLVAHCAYTCVRFSSALQGRLDLPLFLSCVLRVLMFLPRPRFWLAMRAHYREARFQPTPQLVARRLQQLHANPPGAEQLFGFFFHGWLAFMALLLWAGGGSPTAFSAALWEHLQANLAALVLVRLASAGMFLWLQRLDLTRGLPAEVLESFSTLGAYAGAAGEVDCAVCYGELVPGVSVRTLRCKHVFHAPCVDRWLLQKKNTCPLCMQVVGPEAVEEEAQRE